MKQILCYGDSNTWGHNPDSANAEDIRYPYGVRWSSRLEMLLGEGYRVQEEGLGGRSTVFDDPVTEGRNGWKHYYVCYESARPVELVVFMLGTNDVRPIFHASPEMVALGMEKLGVMTERFSREDGIKMPKILIISPVPVAEGVEYTEFAGIYDNSSVEKSRKLAGLYRELAKNHGWEFLDAGEAVTQLGKDGVHLTPQGHQALAEAVYEKIKEMNL